MIKTRIIPCLDVDNGRVVKGINFVDLKDAGDPVKQAKFYSDNGADEITFLDITATHQKRKAMVDIIERTANECLVPLTVGGGIKSIEDMNIFLSMLEILPTKVLDLVSKRPLERLKDKELPTNCMDVACWEMWMIQKY